MRVRRSTPSPSGAVCASRSLNSTYAAHARKVVRPRIRRPREDDAPAHEGVFEAMAYSTHAPRRPDLHLDLVQQRIPLAVASSIALQWGATLWINQLEVQTGLGVGYSGWAFLFMAAVSLGTLLGVGLAWGFYSLFALVLAGRPRTCQLLPPTSMSTTATTNRPLPSVGVLLRHTIGRFHADAIPPGVEPRGGHGPLPQRSLSGSRSHGGRLSS